MTRASITALALALALFTRAEAAEASSCGSGGGDSGGSSDSGSSDSGDSGGSDSTPSCVDSTDVHGYRECTRFGRWAASPRTLIFEAGLTTREFSNLVDVHTGSVTHEDESFNYRLVGPSESGATRDRALVSTLRIGGHLSRHLYAAADLELGGLVTRAPSSVEMTSSGQRGSPRIASGAAVMANVLGVLGARGQIGAGVLGAEVAGGFQSVTYTFESQYGACIQNEAITVGAPVLEARVRAQLWLSPFVTAGAHVGSSMIDRGAWSAGVHLGVVTRAFGGGR